MRCTAAWLTRKFFMARVDWDSSDKDFRGF
jgi:hypothetical protein